MKRNPHENYTDEVIVYQGAVEKVTITKEDFESDEAFYYWRNEVQKSQRDQGQKPQLMDSMDGFAASFSAITESESVDAREILLFAMKVTTPKQFSRLWMYYMEGLTLQEIAAKEGVAFQNVHASIQSARKRVMKAWRKKK